jgi:NTE family protein
MSSIGLVLGAGGLTGQAFHAGVLAGIAEATGWDPGAADLVVGTSAGAGMGMYLRLGITPADMLARLDGGALSPAGQAVVDSFGEPGDWTQPTVPRQWRPPNPQLLGRLLRTPWKVRPEALLGVALPTGRMDTELWTSALRAGAGTIWPSAPLWICAVRMDDAHRVVFGRPGAPHTDVATAVGASSAIPGYFAPVTIHGRRYVDGGVHSPTNADVLRREQLDIVLVSSPMSISNNANLRRPSRALRGHFRARLRIEQRKLRRAGTDVRVFQPSEDDLRAMGSQAMDDDRMAAVAAQARLTTLRRLAERPLDLRAGATRKPTTQAPSTR